MLSAPLLRALGAASLDDARALRLFEAYRWRGHHRCPWCGSRIVYRMGARDGGRERNGRWRCKGCEAYFSVRTGTTLEETRVPLRAWALALLLATRDGGLVAYQLSTEGNVKYPTALYMIARMNRALGGPLGSTRRERWAAAQTFTTEEEIHAWPEATDALLVTKAIALAGGLPRRQEWVPFALRKISCGSWRR